MGKSAPPAPDPDPQIGAAALKQAKTGEQWLSFARDAFAISQERQKEIDAVTKELSQLQIDYGKDQLDFARDQRERYKNVYQPIEDEFIAEARDYGSAERQDQAAATAKADVETAAAAQRNQQDRAMAAAGIAPGSGRYAGIERATGLNTALQSAGAQNNARTLQRDKGLALKADVVNLGRGLPATSAQAAAAGLGATSGAAALYQGANSQYLASTGIMGAGYQGQMAGYAGQANTLQNVYGTQAGIYNSQLNYQAQSAAGLGSAVGGLFGLFLSDKNAKKNKKPIKDGKALEAVQDMPVEEWDYKEGAGDEGRHVGPYAQDFARATGKGDGRTIPVQDVIGITMKAVQDLDKKVDKLASGIRGKMKEAA